MARQLTEVAMLMCDSRLIPDSSPATSDDHVSAQDYRFSDTAL
jgi:hypothetical protein